MDGELHDGVVAFRQLSSGREAVVLGCIDVGEISPVADPRSRYPICFRIMLPGLAVGWHPARDLADARAKSLSRINDWLNAAELRPNGGNHGVEL